MKKCIDNYGPLKNPEKEITNINKFCKSLSANKVKGSKELFEELQPTTQCMFLDYGYRILKTKNIPPQIYRNAFYLFKLFRGKDLSDLKTYKKYKGTELEKYYKQALDWNRENKDDGKKGGVRTKKVFDKKYQKHETPKGELDPLYIYYTSLYTQNPKSKLATVWLTEHGVYDGEERMKLVGKYEKLKEL